MWNVLERGWSVEERVVGIPLDLGLGVAAMGNCLASRWRVLKGIEEREETLKIRVSGSPYVF